MQIKFSYLALGALLAFGTSCATLAQDNPAPSQDQGQAGAPAEHPTRAMRMDPDHQLARLTQELNLTSDQQTQIKPMLVDRQEKMQALMQNQSLSQDDRRQQARSIMESSNKNIKSVLHDDQKQKFDAMMERGRRPSGAQAPPSQPQL
jgi:periplasmic protein CpxP/Spy